MVRPVIGTPSWGDDLNADLDGIEALALSAGGSYSGNALPSVPLTKTTNYTASVGQMILADATAGPITITLPLSPLQGGLVTVKKIDTSSNVVTVVGQGGSLIDGDANCLITSVRYGAIFTWDNAMWRITAVTASGGPSGPPGPTGPSGGTGPAGPAGPGAQPFVWVSGRYYGPALYGASGGGGATGGTWSSNNFGVYTPHIAPIGGGAVSAVGMFFDGVGGTGSIIRIGIYPDNGSGVPTGPGVETASPMSGNTSGYVEATFTSPVAVAAGLFWVLTVPQIGATTPGPRRIQNLTNHLFGATSGANGATSSPSPLQSGTITGALPTTPTFSGTGSSWPVTTVKAS